MSSIDERTKRQEITNILCSFIEVAIHTLLYVRGLYPREVFERRKEFGVPVWMCRHPGLTAGIHDAILASRDHVLDGSVESIIMVILDQSGRAIEAYPFDVENSATEDIPATYR